MTDIVEKLRSTWAHSHNTLVNPNGPEGADEIKRLREENKKLRETVEFYAIESNWDFWLKNQSIANIRAWQTLQELK